MKTKNGAGLDARELGTVLAALRCYHDHLNESDEPMPSKYEDIATDAGKVSPLTAAEVDALVERFNVGDAEEMAGWDLLGELVSAVRDLKDFGGPGGTAAEEAVTAALEKAEREIDGEDAEPSDLGEERKT